MAVGDVVNGRLKRSITGTGSWNDDYQPAAGVEVVIFNLILEVDFQETSGSPDLTPTETVMAEASLYDGTDAHGLVLDSVSVTGVDSQADYEVKSVAFLGTPMKLPLTNSRYLRLNSSLSGGTDPLITYEATGACRLWYSGIQTK